MTEEIRRLLRAGNRVVGLKQTVILIESGLAGRVVLARDADEHFQIRVALLCKTHGVPIETVSSRAVLGRECGIDVGAGVVGLKRTVKKRTRKTGSTIPQ
ncbi:MAG: ribosomal L7Ae/L30e/S12e/Gadd45 family protein [Clostridiales bacterium]|jgi:large subunit ribosomal protein L7A|nr:ribosomal L7Ae/L30e/S12e/Gadd45 family protein [Clostridiales bacterium]